MAEPGAIVPESGGDTGVGGGTRPAWRALAGDAAIYTVGNVVNRVFPFLLLPVLTRYLTPAEYGTFVLFQVVVNFLLPIVGCNGDTAVARMYVETGHEDLRRYISTVLGTTLLAGAAGFVVSVPLRGLVGDFLDIPSLWIPVAVVVTTGEAVKAVALALWQMQKRSRLYAGFTILQTAVRFAACLIPVTFFHAGLEGLLWAYSVSLLLFAAVGVGLMTRDHQLGWIWGRTHLRSFIRYGAPLIPHRMAGWLTGMADRVVIARLATLGEVGIYSVGYSLGAAVALVQEAFNRAWVPFFFERLKRGDPTSRLRIVEFIYWYSGGMIVAALAVIIGAHFIFPFLGVRFAAAEAFVAWIAVAYAVNGIYKMYANFLFYSQRTYVLSSITITAGAVGILLTVGLVRWRGVIGAGYASLLGQLLACLAVIVAARRMFAMPWAAGLASAVRRVRRVSTT